MKKINHTIIVCLLIFFVHSAYAVQYEIIDLGTFGANSYARDINDRGEIVGTSYLTDNTNYAFLWSNGIMTNLNIYGTATGINDNGQIVGGYENSSGEMRAFLYDNSTMTDLGTLGGNYSNATAINNSGQISGYSRFTNQSTGNEYAFLYENGVMESIGTLGGYYSVGSAINNSGQIVGQSNTISGDMHAYSYQDGVFNDLGTLGLDNESTAQEKIGSGLASCINSRNLKINYMARPLRMYQFSFFFIGGFEQSGRIIIESSLGRGVSEVRVGA